MLFPARMRKKIASIFFSRGIGVFLLASFFFFTTLTGVASAQTETLPATTSYNVPNTNPDVVQNQHTLVQSVMIEVISAAMCQLTGVDMIDPTHGCLGIDMTTHKLGYAPVEERSQNGGLLGMMGNMIGATYDAPVHTGEFVHYIASSFTPTHSAYAQSATEGFARLTPLLNVWRVFRNVAYLVLVLVFVLVGLGIMLRTKIDPRTVMSVQNQLPKIVVGILLITFSYAIAGLLVDTMWTATYLGINIVG